MANFWIIASTSLALGLSRSEKILLDVENSRTFQYDGIEMINREVFTGVCSPFFKRVEKTPVIKGNLIIAGNGDIRVAYSRYFELKKKLSAVFWLGIGRQGPLSQIVTRASMVRFNISDTEGTDSLRIEVEIQVLDNWYEFTITSQTVNIGGVISSVGIVEAPTTVNLLKDSYYEVASDTEYVSSLDMDISNYLVTTRIRFSQQQPTGTTGAKMARITNAAGPLRPSTTIGWFYPRQAPICAGMLKSGILGDTRGPAYGNVEYYADIKNANYSFDYISSNDCFLRQMRGRLNDIMRLHPLVETPVGSPLLTVYFTRFVQVDVI